MGNKLSPASFSVSSARLEGEKTSQASTDSQNQQKDHPQTDNKLPESNFSPKKRRSNSSTSDISQQSKSPSQSFHSSHSQSTNVLSMLSWDRVLTRTPLYSNNSSKNSSATGAIPHVKSHSAIKSVAEDQTYKSTSESTSFSNSQTGRSEGDPIPLSKMAIFVFFQYTARIVRSLLCGPYN